MYYIGYFSNAESMPGNKKLILVVTTLVVTILIVTPIQLVINIKAQTRTSVVSNNNNNTSQVILHRGIISSEPGQPEQLKVQRTIILQHRADGKDYTGILTFTASKPVEVILGHRLNIDNKTLSNIDTKRFGNLFLVNPIHPNAGYVLSAPTIITPNYSRSLPPYYSASIPFVASSVVLRTLGGVPFIAVYEVNAQVGQPQVINNLTTANISIAGNNTR